MIGAILLSIAIVVICLFLHYGVLTQSVAFASSRALTQRARGSVFIFAIVLAHALEIWLYAVTMYFMGEKLGLGHVSGDFGGAFIDYVYFSAVNYSSLGLGDIWPHGPIRLITGVEAINGLILIGWSIAFTYPLVQEGRGES